MRRASWLGVLLFVVATAHAQPANKGRRGAKAAPVAAEDIAKLGGADLEAAATAATTLGASTAPAAHEALLDALALGLPPAVAVPAIAAVAARPVPTDVPALERYAGHHNPSVRAAAVTALAAYKEPAATAAVVAALGDPIAAVRNAAAAGAGTAKINAAIEPMLALLAKGEESSARGLAAIADPDLARVIADRLGKVPDATLALTLGAILVRSDFGPDTARVEVVRAIGKIQDASAVRALADYVDATPKTPPRTSVQEATMIIRARGGAK